MEAGRLPTTEKTWDGKGTSLRLVAAMLVGPALLAATVARRDMDRKASGGDRKDREASGEGAEPSSVTATTKNRCRRLRRWIPVDADVDCQRRSAEVERG
ncbi:hypothetical protein TIFTF001_028333 [Ficus carica]|uniref:Uncharacterized protein n=1 Tax=Ficus carica TaxID=3494 RepID=A0AA88DPR1_FICCA|nr:hypothetical protein TIFTF001_028333 [Ficus carica]